MTDNRILDAEDVAAITCGPLDRRALLRACDSHEALRALLAERTAERDALRILETALLALVDRHNDRMARVLGDAGVPDTPPKEPYSVRVDVPTTSVTLAGDAGGVLLGDSTDE